MRRFGKWLTVGLAVVALTATGLLAAPASATIQVLCKGVTTAEVANCNPAYAQQMKYMHWRMYAGHNCVNYVAWQLGVNGVPEPRILMGNARDWAASAKKLGYVVNTTPAVGAIGVWPGRNHATYVAEVGNGYLITQEDNYPGYYKKGLYQELRIPTGDSSYPAQFIHFKDLMTAATPTVAGTPQVGATVAGAVAAWRPAGIALAWQWLRDGAAIPGATDADYPVAAADVGHALSLRVTGTKAGLATTQLVSAATARVLPGTLTNSSAPTIAGTSKVGSALSAAVGSWRPGGITYAYQWQRAGAAIPGATGSAYTLTTADLGAAVTARITAVKPGYRTRVSTTPPTAAIARGTLTNPVAPVITGVAKSRSKLTVNVGTWTPDAIAYAYRWLRAGAVIAGATQPAYTLAGADIGKTISVEITGTKAGYTTLKSTTASTAAVVGETILNKARPTISGAARVGSRLTATGGTWLPATVKLSYQWVAAGTAIRGATARTFVPTAAQRSKPLTVRVRVAKVGFVTRTVESARTVAVAAPRLLINRKAPVISGSARVGRVLKATAGTWSPGPVRVTYQWYRAGKAIKGGTRSSYKLTTADRGRTLTVRATAVRAGYPKASKTARATARVR